MELITGPTTAGAIAVDGWPAAAIDLDGVVSVLDGFPVLTGADLLVARGELVLVSGPNGAGKTSLLRLIAGLLPVSSGRAVVLGHDLVADRHAHRRHLALIGQDTFCYDELTVRRNLVLHARVAGVSTDDVDRVIGRVGLREVAGVVHGRLSTGQRRRCALAVGLLRPVELVLLDEPHSGLDPSARDGIDQVIHGLRGDGATVVFASHELDRARDLADREVVVLGGTQS